MARSLRPNFPPSMPSTAAARSAPFYPSIVPDESHTTPERDRTSLEFDTERLRVRHLSNDDEALFCRLYTDADTMRFIGEPLSPERVARNFRKAVACCHDDPRGHVYMTILEKPALRPIGICALIRADARGSRAEVGMMLVSTARRQGYSTECLGGWVSRVQLVFPIDEVWVQYSPGHSAAERLVVSLGFLPQADVVSGDGQTARRVWSLHRPTAGSTSTFINQGDENVERHQFS